MLRSRHLLLAAAAAALIPTIAAAQDGRRDGGDRPDAAQQRGDRGPGQGRDGGFGGGDRPQPQQAQPQQAQQQQAPPQQQTPPVVERGQFRGRDQQPQPRSADARGYDGGDRRGDAAARDQGRRVGVGRYPDGQGGAAYRPAPGNGYAGYDGRRDPRQGDGRVEQRRGDGYARPDGRFDQRAGNRWEGRGAQGGYRTGWRQDRRYDWRGYRDHNRQLFDAPRYVPPRGHGYGYRPFSIGVRLDPWFYASSYWIADPYAYRLPPVDGPYRWVRYYDDVLLIDLRSGEVVDAIQDFFF